mmetsp:Transcript_28511/g.69523  ORF Transcript_28511/g.69523 Transcript_28511/m.69523 type:complete len:205 (+) Transcript_28511:142-756(+)
MSLRPFIHEPDWASFILCTSSFSSFNTLHIEFKRSGPWLSFFSKYFMKTFLRYASSPDDMDLDISIRASFNSFRSACSTTFFECSSSFSFVMDPSFFGVLNPGLKFPLTEPGVDAGVETPFNLLPEPRAFLSPETSVIFLLSVSICRSLRASICCRLICLRFIPRALSSVALSLVLSSSHSVSTSRTLERLSFACSISAFHLET